MSVIDLIIGVGNVKNSSVWIHVALGALSVLVNRQYILRGLEGTHHLHRSQNSMVIAGTTLGGGLMSASIVVGFEVDEDDSACVSVPGIELVPLRLLFISLGLSQSLHSFACAVALVDMVRDASVTD